MNKLKINGSTEFMGIQLPVIEGGFGEDKKCILAKDVAEIHTKQLKHINEAINKNRKRFKDNIDIIDLKTTKFEVDLVERGIYTQNALNRSNNIYLLSSTGYAILLNILEEFDIQIVCNIYKNYFKTNYFTFINTYKRDEHIFFNLIEPTIQKLGLTLERQYSINKKRLDGYVPELKLAIEYDENNHNHYNQINEKNRQHMFENKLGCEFVRVSDEYDYGTALSIVIYKIIKIMNKYKKEEFV